MSILDLIGAFLSLSCTILFVRASIYAWPLGAIAIPFDAYVYFHSQLYGDMMLQGLYFASTFYGWWQWRCGGENHKDLVISTSTIKSLVTLFFVVSSGVVVLHQLLEPFNLSHIAFMDALTTTLSLSAQWLLCKKKIETWFIWLVVDAIYVYLYAIKALPFHSVMAFTYLMLAICGYMEWRKMMKIDLTKVNDPETLELS